MSLVAAATSGTRALWYLTRGTGLVALLLLTASLLLGILEFSQWSGPGWPRFLTAGLHKNISLLVTVFLGLHIVTSVLDSFAPITWLDAIVPFGSRYRPMWLGLGALSCDLLIALTITSLSRTRLGYRAWRAVHWLSYACWPVALVHGLGTGSDTRSRWVLALTLSCAALVLAAVWWRIAKGWPSAPGIRIAAVVASVVAPIVLVAWLVTGPLRPGWSSRAGTPSTRLSSASSASPGVSGSGSPPTVGATAGVAGFRPPFAAGFSGTATRSGDDNGDDTTLTVDAALQSGAASRLHVVLQGPAASDGTVQPVTSSTTLGPVTEPDRYRGRVTSVQVGGLSAQLVDGAGRPMILAIRWQFDGNRVSGRIQAT